MELPSQAVDMSRLNWPLNIVLADPTFHQPGPIDLIFGVENFYDLLREEQIKNSHEEPLLQSTALGWVVSGRVNVVALPSFTSFAHMCSTPSLEEQLTRFWEIEACHSKSTLSLEESACEEHFATNTIRNSSGRFVVALPKRSSVIAELGNSKAIATRRFLSLERRLTANPVLKEAYSEFIHEYAQLGHMKLINDIADSDRSSPSYYLPHHCVVRPDSITTKLRVVFDASCSTDTGVSLNDLLMVGPLVQDDLLTIILRFRMPQFAIISDIEKMYRQILVCDNDQPLQRILWRDLPSQQILSYQLTTVTYGTSSAPYLATKSLQRLAEDSSEKFPVAAEVIRRDFYMDDMLSGVDSVEEGQELCRQLIHVMNSAGFQLRKWASNEPKVLEGIPLPLRDERTIFDLDSSVSPIKTLGLQWDTSTDAFLFEAPKHSEQIPITKRVVLSDIARLFDPLGLVGPIVVLAKLFMQELWREGKNWDDALCDSHQRYWSEFRDNLHALSLMKIPRWVVSTPSAVCLELHGFCDAPEKAYGACIYVRAVSSSGSIHVNLLTAKSKVAPIGKTKKDGTVCLPRLELSAALLLSHLFEKVQSSLNLKGSSFFWTDSTIVLAWLSASPSRWKTFVANRTSEIQRITTKGIWAHVPATENPADVISRVISPTQLHDFVLWWSGPPWLSMPSRFWSPFTRLSAETFTPEQLEERVIALPIQVQPPNELFLRYSSFNKLVRVVSWIQRFSFNSRIQNRYGRKTGFLSVIEIKQATHCLVKLAQDERFSQDLAEVARNEQVKQNSRLKTLTPILTNGVLRVGGRLRHAPVSYDQRHPMILPDKHPFTELLVVHYHRKLLHAGPQLLIATIRERFWPLRIRNLARQTVHSCVSCFRCKPKILQQLMGELPPERVTPAFPFLRTGLDYCGPFYYRQSRRAAPVKCFVSIFVCLVTKAVHIECVGDLSTNSFLAALKRFVARRGKPELIECDNATNFKGAQRELNDLAQLFLSQQHQELITTNCTENGITFKFIPPRSPNFGGLWEAAVKSLKKHLRSTVGNVVLYQDEFLTILTQIESCLNSRPLTQLSSDPNDLEVLTPGHFLVHRSLAAIPEPSLEDVPSNRLDRWQQTQEYVRRIWKQWQSEYLSGLQPRTQWTQQRDNISVGTMVLVKEENLPPLKWKFGRILQVFTADDGNIRVVNVRTKDGEFRRGISKICVLLIQRPTEYLDDEATDPHEGT
ncbi:uncharacterized protein LOC131680803 [Topomyia yanbarensis]|uniref:uncharacterized protein LOC131680803 n=1 Tax=Topomyia yanbarensis TaxID=2498891 RepID=UPI00273AF644|nr:uncharacterized protein LOC131680803 [Topomyia yanbarensis]